MIACLFEGRQHQDGLLHLGQTMTSNAENFAATGHQIRQEGDVPTVDGHSVALHRVVDLRHDGLPGRFDAQHRRHLVRVVRRRLGSHYACGRCYEGFYARNLEILLHTNQATKP